MEAMQADRKQFKEICVQGEESSQARTPLEKFFARCVGAVLPCSPFDLRGALISGDHFCSCGQSLGETSLSDACQYTGLSFIIRKWLPFPAFFCLRYPLGGSFCQLPGRSDGSKLESCWNPASCYRLAAEVHLVDSWFPLPATQNWRLYSSL